MFHQKFEKCILIVDNILSFFINLLSDCKLFESRFKSIQIDLLHSDIINYIKLMN
jgi:hypothetical protein